jgi:hypothetical protein
MARTLIRHKKRVALLDLQFNSGIPLWNCLPINKIAAANEKTQLPLGWQHIFLGKGEPSKEFLEKEACGVAEVGGFGITTGMEKIYSGLHLFPLKPLIKEMDGVMEACLSFKHQARLVHYWDCLCNQLAGLGYDALVVINDPGFTILPGNTIRWLAEKRSRSSSLIFSCSEGGLPQLVYEINVMSGLMKDLPTSIAFASGADSVFGSLPIGAKFVLDGVQDQKTKLVWEVLESHPIVHHSGISLAKWHTELLSKLSFVRLPPMVCPELSIATLNHHNQSLIGGKSVWLQSAIDFLQSLTRATESYNSFGVFVV